MNPVNFSAVEVLGIAGVAAGTVESRGGLTAGVVPVTANTGGVFTAGIALGGPKPGGGCTEGERLANSRNFRSSKPR